MTHRIGIDLGGTKIEGIVLQEDGRELLRRRIDTEQDKGYEHILTRIKGLYDELKGQTDPGSKHAFGIGTPGAVSARTGLLKNSNTVCLNGMPFKQDLETLFGRKIAVQNDANCFAMAEALYGAGRGREMVFGVIMGTGCGGGIVHKGEVWTGLQAIGGEWGHTSIDPQGPPCYCGARGCVETFISGGGLERLFFEEYGEKNALEKIVADYRSGNARACEFMQVFFRNFGRAMANLINVLDPEVIVLGGGLSNIDELYTEGVCQVEKCIFSDCLDTPIVRNQLGDSAGVIGAALIGC